MAFIGVKGTHDIFADEADVYYYIQNVFKAICELYGYREIQTPILEYTDVFDRSTGESSDVVRKEMYTFLDKGNRSVTLRPEGTAGVMRSIVENKLYVNNDLPLKTYYYGPVFRYERPQLGRYRQFFQAGVEAVGVDSARLDAETIALAMQVLSYLGFKNLKLKINTLGDASSRAAYKEALKEYFAKHIDSMCEDCKARLVLNPMRILDCKVPEDQEIVKGAPKMSDYLSLEASQRFGLTLSIINSMGIDYEVDESLVRGLDYYGQVVFEVHALSDLGKDYGALLGGGHYDGLLTAFNGPKDIDHGVGFALGVERIYSLMKDNNLINDDIISSLDIYMMPLGEEVMDDAFELTQNIRLLGYSVEMPFVPSKKIATYFKKAEKHKARFAIILGVDELEKGVVQIKNLNTQEQIEASLEDLDITLDKLFNENEHCDCDCEEDHHCHCHHEEE